MLNSFIVLDISAAEEILIQGFLPMLLGIEERNRWGLVRVPLILTYSSLAVVVPVDTEYIAAFQGSLSSKTEYITTEAYLVSSSESSETKAPN